MRVRTVWNWRLIVLPLVALGLTVIVYKTEPAARKDLPMGIASSETPSAPAVAAVCRSLISFYDEPPLIREFCVRTVYRK